MGRLRSKRPRAVAALCCGVVALFALAMGAGIATASSTKSSAHAKSKSTFVVANTSSVQKLDPDVVTNFLDFQALGLTYDTLVQFNNGLQVVPDLATSWKFSNGNRVLTFQLRKGVKFDDGSQFTSANVVASLERAQNPKTADASASFIATVKKIVPAGKYAVKLEMTRADSSVLDGLTSVNLSMLSTQAIKAGTLTKKPDGTGPFKFVSWSPNNSYTVAANPNYWGKHPSLQTVEIKTIPSEQSISSAMQAGSVQLGLLTEPQVADHLPSSFKVQKSLDLSYRALMLQDKTGPLANVDNRLAMACALNRRQVVTSSVLGQGVSVGPVPLGPFKSSPVSAVCPTQNISQAKSYLSKAGNPSGFSFTAITSTDLDATSAAQATAVQAQLAQAGITMTIQNLAGNEYIQDWLKGSFQAAFAENGADPDPYVMYDRYFGPGANLSVPAGYSNTTLANLIVKADAAKTPAAQKSDNKAISNYLTSNAVWLWLFDSYDYAVTSSKVHGFSLPPNRQLQSLKDTTVS
jgi:peptide/nickel transport system substrate-binding protein